MKKFKQIPKLLLDQISRDGMSMLLGGGGVQLEETINNSTSGKCNAINHSTHCDIVNNATNCTAINSKGNCSDVNNLFSCSEINNLTQL